MKKNENNMYIYYNYCYFPVLCLSFSTFMLLMILFCSYIRTSPSFSSFLLSFSVSLSLPLLSFILSHMHSLFLFFLSLFLSLRTWLTEEIKKKNIKYKIITVSENNQGLLYYYDNNKNNKNNNTKIPLVVYPHGGPHSNYSLSFSPQISLLLLAHEKQKKKGESEGEEKEETCFFVLTINYRGSTGYSEDSLNSLPGNIGAKYIIIVS